MADETAPREEPHTVTVLRVDGLSMDRRHPTRTDSFRMMGSLEPRC